jgi:hypothetical protein
MDKVLDLEGSSSFFLVCTLDARDGESIRNSEDILIIYHIYIHKRLLTNYYELRVSNTTN